MGALHFYNEIQPSDPIELQGEFNFVFVKAKDRLDLCLEFSEGHSKILSSYGLEGVNTLDVSWHDSEDVYMVVAMCAHTNMVLGGARLHVENERVAIPLKTSLDDYRDEIDKYFGQYREICIGELGGLWIGRAAFGSGLSPLLARAIVALSSLVGVSKLFTFASQFTFELALKLGFRHVNNLGLDGFFAYPTAKFKTAVLIIEDLEKLNLAEPRERRKIMMLRSGSNHDWLEISQKKLIRVRYDLSAIIFRND